MCTFLKQRQVSLLLVPGEVLLLRFARSLSVVWLCVLTIFSDDELGHAFEICILIAVVTMVFVPLKR